jgi:hypothetical protein
MDFVFALRVMTVIMTALVVKDGKGKLAGTWGGGWWFDRFILVVHILGDYCLLNTTTSSGHYFVHDAVRL